MKTNVLLDSSFSVYLDDEKTSNRTTTELNYNKIYVFQRDEHEIGFDLAC